MTQVDVIALSPTEPGPGSDRGPGWRRWAVVALCLALVAGVLGWQWLGHRDTLVAAGSFQVPDGVTVLNDGLVDTRYLFEGEPGNALQIVVVVRNDGRIPVTVRPPQRRIDSGLPLRWLTRGRVGVNRQCNGCPGIDVSAATERSVTLGRGDQAVMVLDFVVSRCPELTGGAFSETDTVEMRTTTLGVDQVRHVNAMGLPLTIAGSGPNTEAAPGC